MLRLCFFYGSIPPPKKKGNIFSINCDLLGLLRFQINLNFEAKSMIVACFERQIYFPLKMTFVIDIDQI